MRYLPQKNRVALDGAELVSLSIAHLQVGTGFGDEDIFGKREKDASPIEITAEADGLRYLVNCYAHEIEKDRVVLRYALPK